MIERQVSAKNLLANYHVFLPKSSQDKVILLLHGWRSKSERWQNVGNALAQKGFLVVAPDLPGFGKSQEPSIAWGISSYAEWLKELSEKVPELKNSFYLVGHSFGGSVAIKFSLKHNQQVKKLCLISPSCIRIVSLPQKISRSISRVFKVFYFLPFYESFRKVIYKVFLRRSDYPYVSGIMKEIYLKVIEEDLSHKLSFVKARTRIIWGDRDDLTPIANAYIVHEKIPNSELVVLKDQGHNLHLSCPEVLAEKIVENF